MRISIFCCTFAANSEIMAKRVIGIGETVSTVGAGDNFNAGYIYAMLQGIANPAERIAMAKRWSRDVCRQIGNNISDELVEELKKSNM